MDLQSWWSKQEEPQGLSRHAFMYNKEKNLDFELKLITSLHSEIICYKCDWHDVEGGFKISIREKKFILSTKLQSSLIQLHQQPTTKQSWVTAHEILFSIHSRSCLLHLRLHSVNAMLKSEWSAWEKVNVGAKAGI